MATESKVAQLEKAVITAFSSAGINSAMHFQGEIKFPDLTWQAPPLLTDLEVNGRPLNFLLEPNFAVDLNAMYDFWQKGLRSFKGAGNSFVTPEGTLCNTQGFPKAVRLELPYRVTIPETFPIVDSYSALTFSLEVAHMIASNCFEEAVLDDDNYYVKLPRNRVVGVMNGKVIGMRVFSDADISGLVREYMMTPRGLIRTKVRMDVVARMRSVLWEHGSKFRDFQAVDYLLQVLKLLPKKKTKLELFANCNTNEFVLETADGRLKRLSEAREVMERDDMDVRAKLDKCYMLLVPNVYTEHEYGVRVHKHNRNLARKRESAVIYNACAHLEADMDKLRLAGALIC